ncbi:MAG UNVERIFIED_CONTAM: hypothetical protein LVT10_17925 [Anaerolineae bacterium]
MIQGVMGRGAWIAALFLLLSFGFLFTGLFNSDHPLAVLIILLIGVGLMGRDGHGCDAPAPRLRSYSSCWCIRWLGKVGSWWGWSRR